MSTTTRATGFGALAVTLFLSAAACESVAGVDFDGARLAGPGATPNSTALSCDKSCADLGFECGMQFDACGKPKDCGACKDGSACGPNGKCGCAKKSCTDLGTTCGTQSDGCGGALDCGRCVNPAEACVDGKCKCQPKSCTDQGAECGSVPDGCGGQYNCGSCTDGAKPFCGGEGPNKCGATACVPKTCLSEGKNCGTISDGCGNILNCGTCSGTQTCGGGGVANVCGCVPTTTCAAQGKNCGSIPDGCGGSLDCGACTAPDSCAGGGTANVCGCTSDGTCSECCGTGVDNCGRACTRSTCCGGGGGGGGGCFGAGTLVRMADGSSKPIEQVRAGDRVASFDRYTKTMVAARVTALVVHGPETSKDGFVVLHGPAGNLRVTPNHPLVVDGTIKRADAVRVGSQVVTPGGLRNTPATLAAGVLDIAVRSDAVPEIERAPGNGENTYDLKVDGPGTYFATGILVEQKRLQ